MNDSTTPNYQLYLDQGGSSNYPLCSNFYTPRPPSSRPINPDPFARRPEINQPYMIDRKIININLGFFSRLKYYPELVGFFEFMIFWFGTLSGGIIAAAWYVSTHK